MTQAIRRSAVGRPEIIEPRGSMVRVAVVLVGLIGGLGLGVWALVDTLDGGEKVTLPRLEIPDLSGVPLSGARAQLEDLGFVVSVAYQPNEVVPKGTLFEQDPLPGALVQQGDIVGVLVSDGPLGQSVPDLVGQQSADGLETLARDGLVGVVEGRYSDTVRPGEIIGTEPEAGRRVGDGGTVTMLVSDGPVPRTVPELVGTPLPEALFSIGNAGLGIGTITRVDSPDFPEGMVLSTDPEAGAQLPRNQPISVTVVAPPARSTVPYLVGLAQSTAEQLITEADLVVKVRTVRTDVGSARAGRVVGQGLPPNTKVEPGSTVEIVVATPFAGTPTTAAPSGD